MKLKLVKVGLGVILSLLLMFFLKGPAVTYSEIYPELDYEAINGIYLMDAEPRVELGIVELSVDEIRQFQEIVKATTFRKKRIPNVSAFQRVASVHIYMSDWESTYSLDLDKTRPILGLYYNEMLMKQYYVEKDAAIIQFISNKLNEEGYNIGGA